jgi:hypothetical protein
LVKLEDVCKLAQKYGIASVKFEGGEPSEVHFAGSPGATPVLEGFDDEPQSSWDAAASRLAGGKPKRSDDEEVLS